MQIFWVALAQEKGKKKIHSQIIFVVTIYTKKNFNTKLTLAGGGD